VPGRPVWLILVCCLGQTALALAVSSTSEAQETVDFARDIEPILSQHCWKCHGEQKADGGLRLDTRELAERGGGSGKNALNLSQRHNELLRRVKSQVDGERMPLEGPALSAAQISTLERWIAQGASWPPKPMSVERKSFGASDPSSYDRLFDRWEYVASARFRPVYIAAIVLLVVMLVIERIKNGQLNRWFGKRTRLARHVARLSRAWYVVGLLLLVSCWVVQFARDQRAQVIQANSQTRRGTSNHPGPTQAPKGFNDPFRPQHPPRLGGTYYRGNDERSEDLFNGGFYRTATFHVHLADAEGNDLAWDDPIPEQPHIRFEIIRSRHASPTLFAAGIMDYVGLSPVQPEQRETARDIPLKRLETEEPGERWSVLYPLESIPTTGRLTGKLYVYKGSGTDMTNKFAEPSYLIGYELVADGGKISRQSQIWMASVYNVGTMQWPEPGRIPADHWFDFRPIPEIEQPVP
jgi:hypothetical protein